MKEPARRGGSAVARSDARREDAGEELVRGHGWDCCCLGIPGGAMPEGAGEAAARQRRSRRWRVAVGDAARSGRTTTAGSGWFRGQGSSCGGLGDQRRASRAATFVLGTGTERMRDLRRERERKTRKEMGGGDGAGLVEVVAGGWTRGRGGGVGRRSTGPCWSGSSEAAREEQRTGRRRTGWLGPGRASDGLGRARGGWRWEAAAARPMVGCQVAAWLWRGAEFEEGVRVSKSGGVGAA